MLRKAIKRWLHAAWITSPVALILTIAITVWLAVPVAPTALTLTALATPMSFSGIPTVGALFTLSDGRLGSHFCTASVVNSPGGDLVLTAAHCVAGYSESSPSGMAFIPGYDDGAAPAGVWPVTHVFVDSAWAANANPDDDFAFLTVAQSGHGASLESVTGAENLGIGDPPAGIVRVIGYPNVQSQPIICLNRTTMFSATQIQFDCDDFTVGTSGSPLLVGARGPGRGGHGAVVGVIGGYEQGGDSPDVSYSAAFGQNAQALYDLAVAQR
jgi:V8-like Glu-specific endopeptidase